MSLTNEKKKQYRNLGHNLKPIVTIASNGLSEGVMAEVDRALTDHELVKVKLVIEERDLRKQLIGELVHGQNAELVQEIGKIALLYRLSDKPNIKTSNVR